MTLQVGSNKGDTITFNVDLSIFLRSQATKTWYAAKISFSSANEMALSQLINRFHLMLHHLQNTKGIGDVIAANGYR